MSYQSANVSTVNVSIVKSGTGNADSSQIFQSQLAGAVIQEYDQQIEDATAELKAIDSQKKQIRADKTTLTNLKQNTVLASEGYKLNSEPYAGKGVKMTESEYTEFSTLATSLAINLDNVAKKVTNTSKYSSYISYVVDETTIAAVKDGLDSKLTDLNSTSEMKMIGFQSLMDSRKQSMMMLSNMINSDNQTKMAVIQNMKG